MSGDGRKFDKQFPGSVPRVNNRQTAPRRADNERTNFPSGSWHVFTDSSNFIRNSPRSQRNNSQFVMDGTLEAVVPQDLRFCNGHSGFAEIDSQDSRRNSTSSGLKCDNVTKFPDKNQIENKLKQIREYLQITTAMLGGLKNSDEQEDVSEKSGLLKMRNDLLDSETKLVNILDEINRIKNSSGNNQALVNNNFDIQSQVSIPGPSHRNDSFDSQANGFDNPDIDILREQHLSLLKLQQKAENKLRDARLVQERLSMASSRTTSVNLTSEKDNKNMSLSDFDSAIRELEERTKRLNQNSQARKSSTNVDVPSTSVIPSDRIMNEIECLHGQIIGMRNANNEREQLIEVLDTRDAELRSQQAELQKKLNELQNKKLQVDQLAMELQNINDVDEDGGGSDVGVQVSKIVTMKDQLKKLQDMLEIVKTTENAISNSNTCTEDQLTVNEICQTAENFLQNQIQKARPLENDQNIGVRLENNRVFKETNSSNSRNRTDASCSRSKPSSSSINEKLALKAELEARKKELEEIMGKHKAGTSNLNHDVGTVDNKSDYGSGIYPHYWKNKPNQVLIVQDQGSEGFSSEDENDYSEVHEHENLLPPLHPPSNRFEVPRDRQQRSVKSDYGLSTERMRGFSRSPDRNLRSVSAAASEINTNSNAGYSGGGNELQKQLQQIRNFCDSVLQQQPPDDSQTQSNNFQQVRNNITPSTSVYSEPRSLYNNALNSLQPVPEVPWFNHQMNGTMGAMSQPDMTTYQNWLATNTLQTQSYMLNTLNQCCQMLWLQQREMGALRNSVSMLQEKLDSHQCQSTPTQHNIQHPLESVGASNNLLNPAQSVNKPNQVSAACSMPNLNHYSSPVNQSANLPSFECLNSNHTSTNLNLQVSTEQLNNMLHSLNSNPINIPHIWNGQALNNQVPPGNRANNYWDNFRSYSRQNLLSTKNAECSHPPTTTERPNQLLSVCVPNKSNSNSHENTPHNRKSHQPNLATHATNSHDHVQNICTQNLVGHNHVQNLSTQNLVGHGSNSSNSIEHVQNLTSQLHSLSMQAHSLMGQSGDNDSRLEFASGSGDSQGISEESGLSNLTALLNMNPSNEASLNISEASTSKDSLNHRNEWHEEHTSKMNKSEESREIVYKQVACQLFKDLQEIESDSLRLKVLQSLQNSLEQRHPSNKHGKEPLSTASCSLQASLWERPSTSGFGPLQMCLNQDEPLMQSTYKDIMSLLEVHETEAVNNQLLLALKQVFLGSESFRDTFKDTVFQRHFSNVLDEGLEQFRGKKILEVRTHLIQTIGDLLQSELSFIHLLQETNPGTLILRENQESLSSFNADWPHLSPLEINVQSSTQNGGHAIQNGDLAEADQSRLTENDIEEDIRSNLLEIDESQQSSSEEALSSHDFSSNGEGLDQVPTRLPTKSKSRSSTPNKDGQA